MIKNNQDGWISVEESLELPHVNERVLVVCANWGNPSDRHVTVREFWGRDIDGRLHWSGHTHVTHWMPLPELPKGKCEK